MSEIDLSERPRTREGLAKWYRTVLEDQAASGLSVMAYAKQIGITPVTLYKWRRRLAECEVSDPDSSRPAGLVEVTLASRAATHSVASPKPSFIVLLGKDRGIEVPEQFDDVALGRLITVVEAC